MVWTSLIPNIFCCVQQSSNPRQRKQSTIGSQQQLLSAPDIPGCVFCDIHAGRNPDVRKIQYTDARVFVLPDKYPAAASHLLVLPTRHIGTVKDLSAGHPEHIELVQHMLAVGKAQPQCTRDTVYGFHVPPFNSIDHLHLHCVTPPYRGWRALKYAPHTAWFMTADELLDKLRQVS